MNTTGIPAEEAIDKVLADTKGLPAYLTGSSVSAEIYEKPNAYTDIDLFVPNEIAYAAVVATLLSRGYAPEDDKFVKSWNRQLKMGIGRWHTNSMKLLDQATGTEVNVIYKLVDNHPTTRLSQVLESFDFGILAMGYETETGVLSDMRQYFFGPGAEDGRPLGLLPYREEHLRQGFMSQFLMLRTAGRYSRYANEYGYDLSLVKPVLVEGYKNYASYKANRTKPDDITLGSIAAALAQHIEFDEFTELAEFERSLPKADSIDQILAGLE